MLAIDPKSRLLLAQVLKARYFPDGDFLGASRGARPSWAWVSLLEGRRIILDGSSWLVENGKSIKIWHDRWIPGFPPTRLVPSQVVTSLIRTYVESLLIPGCNLWDLSQICNLTTSQQRQIIWAIPLNSFSRDDRRIWPWNRNGDYSVRSGYHWLFDSISFRIAGAFPPTVDARVWRHLWKMKNVPKVTIFM